MKLAKSPCSYCKILHVLNVTILRPRTKIGKIKCTAKVTQLIVKGTSCCITMDLIGWAILIFFTIIRPNQRISHPYLISVRSILKCPRAAIIVPAQLVIL